MDIKEQNRIVEIANSMRPDLNRPVFTEETRLERIDMLRCAILKKNEENRELKRLLDMMTDIERTTFTLNDDWDIVPHYTKKGKLRGADSCVSDDFMKNVRLCDNE